MLEKIIHEIKDAEKESDERINQVKEQEYVRLKEFKLVTENEREKINEHLNDMKKKIITEYESQAQEELKSLVEEARKTFSALDKISLKKDTVVDSIVKDLLREKK